MDEIKDRLRIADEDFSDFREKLRKAGLNPERAETLAQQSLKNTGNTRKSRIKVIAISMIKALAAVVGFTIGAMLYYFLVGCTSDINPYLVPFAIASPIFVFFTILFYIKEKSYGT